MMMTRRALAFFASLAALSAFASADTIRLQDGTTLANVQVVSEGLKEVAYKEGKNDKTVASESVASIDYEKKPKAVDEADGLAAQGDLDGAATAYRAYVEAAIQKPVPAAQKWAPAYAAWRVLQLSQELFDLEGQKSAAGQLIQSFGDSRFVPAAYLAKAAAEQMLGQGAQALKTLGELNGLIDSQVLAKRWKLECRLALTQSDDKVKPESKRNEYEIVAGESADLPIVQAQAQVLIGEAYLAEAAGGSAKAKDLRAKAKAAFEKAIASAVATRQVVAAAHAGRGECLFLLGADANDTATLLQASFEFLRVATLYRDQGAVLARSLFYAMRSFDLMSDPRRKAEMKRELITTFEGSHWAEEAKKF